MRYPHRCNNCRSRFTLLRKRAQYERLPRCPQCGSRNYHFDTNKFRERLARRRQVCTCYGLAYPHRKASTPFCIHHPTGPTDGEYRREYENQNWRNY